MVSKDGAMPSYSESDVVLNGISTCLHGRQAFHAFFASLQACGEVSLSTSRIANAFGDGSMRLVSAIKLRLVALISVLKTADLPVSSVSSLHG